MYTTLMVMVMLSGALRGHDKVSSSFSRQNICIPNVVCFEEY